MKAKKFTFEGRRKKYRRGYIFSIDAMLAVLIAVIFFITFTMPALEKQSALDNYMIQKTFDDALSVLDEEGILDNMDTSEISSRLNSIIPERFAWQLIIEEYSFQSEGFIKVNEHFIGTQVSDDDVISGQRFFLSHSNGINNAYKASYKAGVE